MLLQMFICFKTIIHLEIKKNEKRFVVVSKYRTKSILLCMRKRTNFAICTERYRYSVEMNFYITKSRYELDKKLFQNFT